MRKTRLAIIGTVGIPARYGGFETLAEQLAGQLGAEMDISVYCSGRKYSRSQRLKSYKGARLIYLPFNANGIQSIVYDALSILHALFFADVLLVLGVSGGFMLPLLRLFKNKKVVTSIDGIEWRRNKWSNTAKRYLEFAEGVAIRFSTAGITDNEAIQDYTAQRYKKFSHMVEYGADHVLRVKPEAGDYDMYDFMRHPYAFKVCRIEPENNIHVVLEAFARLGNYTLVMVGNWNNSSYGKEMRARYSAFANIRLLDPIYDQRALDLLRSNCHIYLHGHSAGGTNPSLVEAMYLGLPVVAFDVSYNRSTTEGKALYFSDVDTLASTIRAQSFPRLQALGKQMLEIAQRRYTWRVVASKYAYIIQYVARTVGNPKLASAVSQSFSKEYLRAYELAHLESPDMFYE